MKRIAVTDKRSETIANWGKSFIEFVYMLLIIVVALRGLIYYGIELNTLGLITIKESIFMGMGIISMMVILKIMNIFHVTFNVMLAILIIPQMLICPVISMPLFIIFILETFLIELKK